MFGVPFNAHTCMHDILRHTTRVDIDVVRTICAEVSNGSHLPAAPCLQGIGANGSAGQCEDMYVALPIRGMLSMWQIPIWKDLS